MEKLKKSWLAESDIINLLGKDVLKRVTLLRDCFENGLNEFGLGMVESLSLIHI